ncbi:MAG: GTPase HflX, partial [Gemmatimonadaceae bacterium]|nr:GTPase HflX [Gemmatimonadaceae bacterium]
LIHHRIKVLKERLGDVERSRAVQRQSRQQHFRAALVGYTNAGKSSVLRHAAGDQAVFVEDRLFATLDPLTREVPLGDGQHVLLTDTVGFIRKLPHHLVASFRATLEEVREADVLLHVIDASHPSWEEHREVVDGVLEELGVLDRPTVHVFNKMDALAPEEREGFAERVGNLYPGSICVSAATPGGLAPLLARLQALEGERRPLVDVLVPLANGKLLAEVHRAGEVLQQAAEDGAMRVRARLDRAAMGRLVRAGAAVEVV